MAKLTATSPKFKYMHETSTVQRNTDRGSLEPRNSPTSLVDAAEMDLPEANPGSFKLDQVTSGTDEHQIVLSYDHFRFVLFVTRPDDPGDDNILSDLFNQTDKSKDNPDAMITYRCLKHLSKLVISECKHTMLSLATPVQKLNGEQLSLEGFLQPSTFYLQLRTVDQKLQAFMIEGISGFAGMHDAAPLPVDFAPQSVSTLTPSAEVEFIEDLFMRKIVKVSRGGEVCVFKSATHGNEGQLQREINVLQQISETWKVDDPNRPKVPWFLGLITSGGQTIGMLEEFIDGTNLQLFNLQDTSSAQRQKWKHQIEQSLTKLHQNGFVWGDVKAENIMIDKADNAWLVDFGGSWTDGWVDEALAETMEGDLQGFSRVMELLDGDLESTSVICDNSSESD